MPNRKVLFIIAGDPRVSARPAEAIRIAAGVGAWKKVDVQVYFHEAAVLSLGEWTDELVEEESFRRYLPLLGGASERIFASQKSPFLTELGRPPVPFELLEDAGLARLAAASDSVLRF
jgi:hypothetical protein